MTSIWASLKSTLGYQQQPKTLRVSDSSVSYLIIAEIFKNDHYFIYDNNLWMEVGRRLKVDEAHLQQIAKNHSDETVVFKIGQVLQRWVSASNQAQVGQLTRVLKEMKLKCIRENIAKQFPVNCVVVSEQNSHIYNQNHRPSRRLSFSSHEDEMEETQRRPSTSAPAFVFQPTQIQPAVHIYPLKTETIVQPTFSVPILESEVYDLDIAFDQMEVDHSIPAPEEPIQEDELIVNNMPENPFSKDEAAARQMVLKYSQNKLEVKAVKRVNFLRSLIGGKITKPSSNIRPMKLQLSLPRGTKLDKKDKKMIAERKKQMELSMNNCPTFKKFGYSATA